MDIEDSLKHFLYRQPKFFFEFISCHYCFSVEDLENWKNYLDWRLVSLNCNINFDLNTIERFKVNLFWYELSQNNAIFWNLELLDNFLPNLYRPDHVLGNPIKNISKSKNVEWNIELIEKLKDKLNWDELSKNEHIPFDCELIKKFENFWNWKLLAFNGKFWNESLVTALEPILDLKMERWNYLLGNKHIRWSRNFLYQKKNKWFIKSKKTGFKTYSLYQNKLLPWDIEFIEFFKDSFNWYSLSESEVIPWSEELIDKFISYWIWSELAGNSSLPWNENLITKYKKFLFSDSFTLDKIMSNPNVNWSENLIDKYQREINWKALSKSKNFNWDEENIDKYLHKIDWIGLCSNLNIKWTDYLIEKYDALLDFYSLSSNTNIAWSEKLLKKYENKIHWSLFSSSNINWSNEILFKLMTSLDWECIYNNRFFPWDLHYINKFQKIIFAPSSKNTFSNLSGTSIPLKLEYLQLLIMLYPDIELSYSIYVQSKMTTEYFHKDLSTNDIYYELSPVLNNNIIFTLIELCKSKKISVKFLNEKEEAKIEQDSQRKMKKIKLEDNYLSRSDLADLGYIEDD
jgi:hypothetical protein